MQPELKPTNFLKLSIAVSSVFIFMIWVYSVFFKTGSTPLETTCLTIPIFSIYIFQQSISRRISYYINDMHWIFWAIFAGTSHVPGEPLPGLALFMLFLFTVIIFKRKSNFMVNSSGVGNN